jgi:hypothetical protein
MAVWDAFKRELYWLKESDRACVECACILRARLWTTGDLKVIGPLMQFLRAMGGTPADRTRISIPDEGDYDPLFDDDPADAYVN